MFRCDALPPGSSEARDPASLLHPDLNRFLHERTGPMDRNAAKGFAIRDRHPGQCIDDSSGRCRTGLGCGEEEVTGQAVECPGLVAGSHLFDGWSHEHVIGLALADALGHQHCEGPVVA